MGDCIQGAFSSTSGKADSVLTTKGDLATYSTTRTRLGVGSNDTVLTADSSEATGLKWGAAAGGGDLEALFDSTLGSAADNITYTAELQASTYGYFVLQASGNVEQQTPINLVFDGASSAEYNYWGATYSNTSARTALAAISQSTLPVATTTVVGAVDDKNNFFLECVFSIDSIITDAVNGTSTFQNFYQGVAETLKFNTWGLLGTAGEINSIALSAPTEDFNAGSRMRIWGAKV